MLIRLLGTASGMPTIDKNHSSIFVTTHNEKILVDCGEGTAQQILKYKIDENSIDKLLITHLHPDHSSGIFMLLQMFYLQKRKKDLIIYLPEQLELFKTLMNYFYLFEEKFPFKIILKKLTSIEVDNQFIRIKRSSHLKGYEKLIKQLNASNKMNSFSIIFEEDSKKFIYTADIENLDHLKGDLINCNSIVVDALHPEPEEILKLNNIISGKIILTHGISVSLQKKLSQESLEKFIKAKDGQSFNV